MLIRSSSLLLAACYFTWSCCFLLKTHLECMPSACCFFQLNNVYNSVVRMFNICYIGTHICTKYRIMAVLNVETAIIWGSGATLLEQALIPVIMYDKIMYDKTIKTIIVFFSRLCGIKGNMYKLPIIMFSNICILLFQ
jgi:hypothetical protein